MSGNDWKYILNYVLWFVSVILNFNAFYDAYTVQRHYTVLLKSNRIFCLLLRIIFGNSFLMVSDEVGDHIWFHFVYFLYHLPIYEEIRC